MMIPVDAPVDGARTLAHATTATPAALVTSTARPTTGPSSVPPARLRALASRLAPTRVPLVTASPAHHRWPVGGV